MNIQIEQMSHYPDAHELLYKWNRDIGCKLDDDALNCWISKILNIGDPIAIIDNGKIIAFILLYCNKMDTLEAYLCNIYVDEHYRGKKLSKLLMQEAIQICKHRSFKVINLDVHVDNIPAIKVYDELGFVETKWYKKDSNDYVQMSYFL